MIGQAVSIELVKPKDAGEFTCWVKMPLKSMMITRGSLAASVRSRSLKAVIQARMPPWICVAAAAPTLADTPASTARKRGVIVTSGMFSTTTLLAPRSSTCLRMSL